MNIKFPGPPYKSIQAFEWRDVPRLVVLTGPNGSGKTQLLELLAASLGVGFTPEGVQHIRVVDPERPRAKADVTDLPNADVQFRRSQWEGAGDATSLDNLAQRVRELWNARNRSETPRIVQLWSLIQQKVGKPRQEITEEEFKEALPANFPLLVDTPFRNANISSLFVSYMNQIEVACRKTLRPVEDVLRELGPMPWNVLDDVLARARLPYAVRKPKHVAPRLYELERLSYTFEVVHQVSGKALRSADLSAGERVILQVALWLFAFSGRGAHELPQTSRLLLLDEPDAHLHPALTRTFLDVVQAELVDKYRVRVIMTTHSPSTVALAPPGSLFIMTPEGPKPAVSRWAVLSQLTSGYVTLGTETKCVFVEDDADKRFFEAAQKTLISMGVLDGERSIAFISVAEARRGSTAGKEAGGKHKVRGFVRDMETSKIAGIIDRDDDNAGEDRLYVLRRYEHENYLLDPVFLYAILYESKRIAAVPGLMLTNRDAMDLLTQPRDVIQAAARAVLDKIKGELANSTTQGGSDSVRYVGGAGEIELDRWFMNMKAATLIELLKKRLGVPIENLLDLYERMQIVPEDLAEMLKEIQRA